MLPTPPNITSKTSCSGNGRIPDFRLIFRALKSNRYINIWPHGGYAEKRRRLRHSKKKQFKKRKYRNPLLETRICTLNWQSLGFVIRWLRVRIPPGAPYGCVAERFKATVLKTVDRKVRGFESHRNRHSACQASVLQAAYPRDFLSFR